MSRHANVLRSMVLPVAILLPGFWIMTGCIYIPWFEHRLDSGSNPRAMVGPATSDRPVRPGCITREKVHEVLGPPAYASSDASSEGYVARNGYGIWVAPLCFAAASADQKAYIVRLNYDSHGMLRSYDWADAYHSYGIMDSPDVAVTEALAKINTTGSTLTKVGQ